MARGEDPGPLAGVPFGVKDLEDCAGHAHLPRLAAVQGPAARSPADSVHVARLRAAGAVPVGKTAAPEFGTLSFTKTKAWGITRNPWDPSRTPGGSSGRLGGGGGGRAGALRHRQRRRRLHPHPRRRSPGLVGFKPSHGRIPHPGPSGSQTAVYGALTTTVADAARHLDVVAGPDDHDRLSLPAAGGRLRGPPSSRSTSPACGPAGRADLGFAAVDPEVRGGDAGRRPRPWPTPPGSSGRRGAGDLTDPVRTWLSAGRWTCGSTSSEDMWPAVADDLTVYSRQVAASRPRTTRCAATPGVAAPAAAAPGRRGRGSSPRSTCCCRPPPPCPPSPPRARPRPIAGQPVGPAMATPFTMLANLCWNPAVSVPAGLSADGLPDRPPDQWAAATPTTWCCAWPASSSRPAPGPATPPDRARRADSGPLDPDRSGQSPRCVAEEALDLFDEGVAGGHARRSVVVALLERRRTRASPRRRRPPRSPGARRRRRRSRGRW